MRTFIIFLGLSILLASVFPFQDFRHLLPAEMFTYPRRTISNGEATAIVVILNWILPALAVAIFMWIAEIPKRARSNAGITLLSISVFVWLANWSIRLIARSIEGGGALYAADALLVYVLLPLKIILLFGAVRLLTNLEPRPAS